jgi:hypothetical protein
MDKDGLVSEEEAIRMLMKGLGLSHREAKEELEIGIETGEIIAVPEEEPKQ